MLPFRILGRILCELTGSCRILENPVGSCIGFLPGIRQKAGLFTKGRTIIFLEGGGGMKNPEKNCLQNQKSPNKLFADMKKRK